MATWVIQLISAMGYGGIVFLTIVENVLPPIPSEVIMPLARFMAAQGRLSWLGVILASTLGSVLGAVPLYYLGRLIGDERVKGFADRHGRWLTVSRADLDRAQQWFDRHGRIAVLVCGLAPGVRSLISIPAGSQRMPLALFLLFTTMGAGLWTTLLSSGGLWVRGEFSAGGSVPRPRLVRRAGGARRALCLANCHTSSNEERPELMSHPPHDTVPPRLDHHPR
jgi:membrane protein DedA with SNARE-associated domain